MGEYKNKRYILSGSAGPWLDYYEEFATPEQAKLRALEILAEGYTATVLDSKSDTVTEYSLKFKPKPYIDREGH